MSASTDLCDQARSCAGDANCERYLLCRRACVTGDCIGACSNNNPASDGIFSTLYKAVQASCSHECQRGANWSCVGHIQWPPAKSPVRELSVRFSDALTSAPIAGISVSMCGPDPECPNPISQATTGPTGAVVLYDDTLGIGNVNQGLDGFLQLSGPASIPDGGAIDIYPTHVYWGFPLNQPHGRLGEPVPLLSTGELSYVTGGTPDAAKGQLAVVALDCWGEQAAGVVFSIGGVGASALTPIYAAGLAPSPSATQTDESGIAFFLNVPPGNYDLVATPVALGRASSKVSVYVHSGMLTEVALAPTPMP